MGGKSLPCALCLQKTRYHQPPSTNIITPPGVADSYMPFWQFVTTDPHKTFARFPDLGWFFATPIPTPPFTCRICSTPAIQVRRCYPRLLHRNPAPPRYPRLQCPAQPPTHFPTRSTTHSDTPRYQRWCSRPSWSRTRSGRHRWC